MPIQSVNDFVVRFANVNGSGSASANELFARAVLRMGAPVAPRNIFPSNIQGLPTWYEVRISQAGYLGARGGTVATGRRPPPDAMTLRVAMSSKAPPSRWPARSPRMLRPSMMKQQPSNPKSRR